MWHRERSFRKERSQSLQERCFVNNLTSIIGEPVEHNQNLFVAVQQSIIDRFSSIIRPPLQGGKPRSSQKTRQNSYSHVYYYPRYAA